MASDVQKLWYTSETVNYSYDITKTQPQLFVTPNFQNLIDVLEQFANKMAFRVGGLFGLQKAIESKNTCTAVYSSGLQVSGTFTDVSDINGQPYFIKTTGPTNLSYNSKQLDGHSKNYHKDGFSSPVGKLKGRALSLEDLNPERIGIILNQQAELNFESGITVKGTVKSILQQKGKTILITFDNCTVTDGDGKTLFDPSWGVYDMAVGEKITSVFCGAADKDAFEEIVYKPKTNTYHPEYKPKTLELHKLYQQVRDVRQNQSDYDVLPNIWQQLQTQYATDWLCALEILEILDHEELHPKTAEQIHNSLKQRATNEPNLKKLITDGFYLIKHPVEQKLIID
jgi:phenylalanine-4-hydroxylase